MLAALGRSIGVSAGVWTEELHPRDHGKFAVKEGESPNDATGAVGYLAEHPAPTDVVMKAADWRESVRLRDKMTEDYPAFVAAVQHWQNGSPPIREAADALVGMENASNPSTPEAELLMAAVTAAPPVAEDLYRGIAMRSEDVPAVGDTIEEPLASWSSSRDVAVFVADMRTNQDEPELAIENDARGVPQGADTRVIFSVEDAKAVPVSALAVAPPEGQVHYSTRSPGGSTAPRTGRAAYRDPAQVTADEYLANGRYEVVDVRASWSAVPYTDNKSNWGDSDAEPVPITVVRLRQTSTYGADGAAIAKWDSVRAASVGAGRVIRTDPAQAGLDVTKLLLARQAGMPLPDTAITASIDPADIVRDDHGRFATKEGVAAPTSRDALDVMMLDGLAVTGQSSDAAGIAMTQKAIADVAARLTVTDDQMRAVLREDASTPELSAQVDTLDHSTLQQWTAGAFIHGWNGGGGGLVSAYRDQMAGKPNGILTDPTWGPIVGPVVRDFAGAQTANTQDWLAAHNVTSIEAYRGSHESQIGEVGVQSWSTASGWASLFGPEAYQTSGGGAVVKADIPAAAIVSLPATGMGTFWEHEVVVLNDGSIKGSRTASIDPEQIVRDLHGRFATKGGASGLTVADLQPTNDAAANAAHTAQAWPDLTPGMVRDRIEVAADDLRIRTRPESLATVAEAGGWRNALDGGKLDSPETRVRAEQSVIGVPPETPNSQRPVYAYGTAPFADARPDQLQRMADYPGMFGAVVFHVDRSVADRSTVTMGDSYYNPAVAIPFADVPNATDTQLLGAVTEKHGIVEFAAFGGVHLSEVRSVEIDPTSYTDQGAEGPGGLPKLALDAADALNANMDRLVANGVNDVAVSRNNLSEADAQAVEQRLVDGGWGQRGVAASIDHTAALLAAIRTTDIVRDWHGRFASKDEGGGGGGNGATPEKDSGDNRWQAAFDAIQEPDGGITLNLDGTAAVHGIPVPLPGYESRKPMHETVEEAGAHFDWYVQKMIAEDVGPEIRFGAWHDPDTHEVVLDRDQMFTPERDGPDYVEKAKAEGLKNGEHSLINLDTGEWYRLGGHGSGGANLGQVGMLDDHGQVEPTPNDPGGTPWGEALGRFDARGGHGARTQGGRAVHETSQGSFQQVDATAALLASLQSSLVASIDPAQIVRDEKGRFANKANEAPAPDLAVPTWDEHSLESSFDGMLAGRDQPANPDAFKRVWEGIAKASNPVDAAAIRSYTDAGYAAWDNANAAQAATDAAAQADYNRRLGVLPELAAEYKPSLNEQAVIAPPGTGHDYVDSNPTPGLAQFWEATQNSDGHYLDNTVSHEAELQKFVDDETSSLRRVVRNSDVFVQVGSEEAVRGIMQSGEMRTLFDPAAAEHSISERHFEEGAAGITDRQQIEHDYFGIPKSATEDRPIYGYLWDKGSHGVHFPESGSVNLADPMYPVLGAYGDIAIQLKGVRDRTTMTVGDSVGLYGHGAPTELTHPGPEAIGFNDLRGASQPSEAVGPYGSAAHGDVAGPVYLEAQIHGGIKLSDIAGISFGYPPEDAATIQAMNDAGVKWTFRHGSALEHRAEGLVAATADQLQSLLASINPDDIVRDSAGRFATKGTAADTGILTVQQIADAYPPKRVAAFPKDGSYLFNDPDGTLQQIQHERGFDALPEVAGPERLAEVKAQGGVELWRGIDNSGGADRSAALAEEFRSGPFFAGRGMYGNGTYASPDRETGLNYAFSRSGTGTDERSLLHMVIKPDAKIADFQTLENDYRAFASTTNGLDYKWMQTFQDPGRLAAAMGYDAMRADSPGHATQYVILNRGAVVVEKARALTASFGVTAAFDESLHPRDVAGHNPGRFAGKDTGGESSDEVVQRMIAEAQARFDQIKDQPIAMVTEKPISYTGGFERTAYDDAVAAAPIDPEAWSALNRLVGSEFASYGNTSVLDYYPSTIAAADRLVNGQTSSSPEDKLYEGQARVLMDAAAVAPPAGVPLLRSDAGTYADGQQVTFGLASVTPNPGYIKDYGERSSVLQFPADTPYLGVQVGGHHEGVVTGSFVVTGRVPGDIHDDGTSGPDTVVLTPAAHAASINPDDIVRDERGRFATKGGEAEPGGPLDIAASAVADLHPEKDPADNDMSQKEWNAAARLRDRMEAAHPEFVGAVQDWQNGYSPQIRKVADAIVEHPGVVPDRPTPNGPDVASEAQLLMAAVTDAPVTDIGLYRGIAVAPADVPEVGDTIEEPLGSWSPIQGVATKIADMRITDAANSQFGQNAMNVPPDATERVVMMMEESRSLPVSALSIKGENALGLWTQGDGQDMTVHYARPPQVSAVEHLSNGRFVVTKVERVDGAPIGSLEQDTAVWSNAGSGTASFTLAHVRQLSTFDGDGTVVPVDHLAKAAAIGRVIRTDSAQAGLDIAALFPVESVTAGTWTEELHPRDHGKFATKEGSAAQAALDRLEQAYGEPVTPIPGYVLSEEDKAAIAEATAKSSDYGILPVHIAASEALERAGQESPRSDSMRAALRSVADELGPTTELRIGNPFELDSERVSGIADALRRVGTTWADDGSVAGHSTDIVVSLGIDTVVLNDGPSSDLAYVTPPMGGRGPSLAFTASLYDDTPMIGDAGYATYQAAQSSREMADMAATHELGHLVEIRALDQTTPGWSSSDPKSAMNTYADRLFLEAAAGRASIISPTTYGQSGGAEAAAEAFTMGVFAIKPAPMSSSSLPQRFVDANNALLGPRHEASLEVFSKMWHDAFPGQPHPGAEEKFWGRTFAVTADAEVCEPPSLMVHTRIANKVDKTRGKVRTMMDSIRRAKPASIAPEDIVRDDHGRFATKGGEGSAPEVPATPHLAHAYLDKLAEILGPPAERVPGYELGSAERLASLGHYVSADKLVSGTSLPNIGYMEAYRAGLAMRERAGLPSPRDAATMSALRAVADQLPPTTTFTLGPNDTALNAERIQGVADGFARVGGPDVLGATHLLSVTMSSPGDAYAWVHSTPDGSDLIFSNRLHETSAGDALGAMASTGAADTMREFAEIATVHEVGHLVHAESVRQTDPPNLDLIGVSMAMKEDAEARTHVVDDDLGGFSRISPSTYGSTNGNEYVAEAFALATTGIRPGPKTGLAADYQEANVERAVKIAGDVWATAFPDRPMPSPYDGTPNGEKYAGRTF